MNIRFHPSPRKHLLQTHISDWHSRMAPYRAIMTSLYDFQLQILVSTQPYSVFIAQETILEGEMWHSCRVNRQFRQQRNNGLIIFVSSNHCSKPLRSTCRDRSTLRCMSCFARQRICNAVIRSFLVHYLVLKAQQLSEHFVLPRSMQLLLR